MVWLLMFGVLWGCSAEKEPTVSSETLTKLTIEPHETMGSILVASWDQDETATSWIEFSVDEGVWLSSPPIERESGMAEELVLGVPFSSDVKVRVAWESGGAIAVGETITAQTADLPDGAPIADSADGDPDQWDNDSPYVLVSTYGVNSQVDGGWAFIVDRQGRTVWAMPANTFRISLQTQLSHDGTQILIDQNSFWAIFDEGDASQIDRVDIEGNVIATYDTPGMHHPFTELADGSLVWGSVGTRHMDELTKLTPDGTQSILFECTNEHLGEGHNYCSSNTIYWDETTDTFLYSFYSTNTVLHIDNQSGEVLNAFGHIDDVWEFDPAESAFWWQHGVHFTDTGTLLVSTKNEYNGEETMVREYALDEENQTLVEAWNFGEGEGVFADTMGEADYTTGGNILHNYGSTARLREVTPEGDVVWDIQWTADYIGRSTTIPDLYALYP